MFPGVGCGKWHHWYVTWWRKFHTYSVIFLIWWCSQCHTLWPDVWRRVTKYSFGVADYLHSLPLCSLAASLACLGVQGRRIVGASGMCEFYALQYTYVQPKCCLFVTVPDWVYTSHCQRASWGRGSSRLCQSALYVQWPVIVSLERHLSWNRHTELAHLTYVVLSPKALSMFAGSECGVCKLLSAFSSPSCWN